MERLQELINQLNEQFEHEAPPSQMLQTARLLEAELAQLSTQAALRKVSANVAVMMPSSMKIYTGEAAMKEFNKEETAPNVTEFRPSATEKVNGASSPVGVPSPVRNGVTASNGTSNNGAANNGNPGNGATVNGTANNGSNVNGSGQRPIVEFVSDNAAIPEMAPEQNTVPEARLVPDPATPSRSASKEQPVGPWPFDPLAEIPTLSQQQPRELNDVIGAGGSSLNDKLKSNVLELKSALNDTPVRDLKKAIGVNDRFVFISQLFRGDEVMYERSLKTINGFRILPEAEYWMERELKVKLGWDENREATKHFYQLVRRRFS